MPTTPNKRIIYAIEEVSFYPDGASLPTAVHGLQSVGMTTTFDLEQVFEIGQSEIYDLIEQIPNIEVTMEKVLDGYPLLYHLGTLGAPNGTLFGRGNQKTNVGISIFNDSQSSASGIPISEVFMSGMFISSVNYNFTPDAAFRESATFVGNNKIWRDTGVVFSGVFNNTDSPIGSGGVQNRPDFIWGPPSGASTLDANGQLVALCTVLPKDIDGINSSGLNVKGSDGLYGAPVQSITVSCDFGRDQILMLGQKSPYFRFMNPIIEVTTEITVIGRKWDNINAIETANNISNQSIRIFTADGTFITTGTKNKQASVGFGGADAGGGGGNLSLTYRYVSYNSLIVKHPADPTSALAGGGAV